MQNQKIIPKKSLGQNFLRSKEILDKIIKAAELSEDDNVLEIGPGEGALTENLVKFTRKIIMVEKDTTLANNIARNFQFPIFNFQSISNESIYNFKNKSGVISGDVLKINLPKLIEENDFFDYKIVANIPYYITGKLFRIIFENKYRPKLMVLMVQKEVAQRICAKTGKMNKLALLVKYFGKAEMVCEVEKENFFPIPKVNSAVIKVEIKNQNFDLEEYEKLFRIIRIGFSSPRKTLINNFSSGLKVEKEKLQEIFKKLQISKNKRAQNISLEKWREIGKNVHTKLVKV